MEYFLTLFICSMVFENDMKMNFVERIEFSFSNISFRNFISVNITKGCLLIKLIFFFCKQHQINVIEEGGGVFNFFWGNFLTPSTLELINTIPWIIKPFSRAQARNGNYYSWFEFLLARFYDCLVSCIVLFFRIDWYFIPRMISYIFLIR